MQKLSLPFAKLLACEEAQVDSSPRDQLRKRNWIINKNDSDFSKESCEGGKMPCAVWRSK